MKIMDKFMKTTIIIVGIIFVSIIILSIIYESIDPFGIRNNDSFEDYIEWCNEDITINVIEYNISYSFIDVNLENGWQITTRNGMTYITVGNTKQVNQSRLDELLENGVKITSLKANIKPVVRKRHTPTIEGYQKWKVIQ